MPHCSLDQLVLQIERNHILCAQRIPESPLCLLIHLLHVLAMTRWGLGLALLLKDLCHQAQLAEYKG